MKEELRIVYQREGGTDPDFEAAVIDLVRQHGWHFWAGGTDLITRKRDLLFDRVGDTRPRLIPTPLPAFKLDPVCPEEPG